MKQFFKTVLAVVVGMLIMNLINGLFYLSFFLLMGLSSLGGSFEAVSESLSSKLYNSSLQLNKKVLMSLTFR